MIDAQARDRLLRRLDELPPHLQERVLAFADALALTEPKGTRGVDAVAALAGVLPSEDSADMKAAIEEAFEQVDPREW